MIIDVDILTEAATAIGLIERVQTRLAPTNLGPFMLGSFQPYLKSRAGSRFEGEGDNATGPWQELAPSTIADREAKGYGGAHPIQRRTDELYDFVTNNSSDIRATLLGTSLVFPSSKSEGKIKYKLGSAQSGNRRTGAPPRPILAMDTNDVVFMTTALAQHVLSGII